jgi:hypothetical protein
MGTGTNATLAWTMLERHTVPMNACVDLQLPEHSPGHMVSLGSENVRCKFYGLLRLRALAPANMHGTCPGARAQH